MWRQPPRLSDERSEESFPRTRRYSYAILALCLAQGLLGLCFAICVPDSLHHHLRVGLGYLRYHATQRVP
jgi:hypothetical protein